jgi:hypothetical protein
MTTTPARFITLVLLALLLSSLACATFRGPGDPVPTRPATATVHFTETPTPEPTLTSTPTPTSTSASTERTKQ